MIRHDRRIRRGPNVLRRTIRYCMKIFRKNKSPLSSFIPESAIAGLPYMISSYTSAYQYGFTIKTPSQSLCVSLCRYGTVNRSCSAFHCRNSILHFEPLFSASYCSDSFAAVFFLRKMPSKRIKRTVLIPIKIG